jgi:hydroxymethylglutaryl-CoA lyase
MANPRQVRELTAKVLERFPPPDETYYTLHFHNTRGMGLANVVAGIEAGVRSFDGSVSGLGGCPFAPGASGNIATEELVYMLEESGVRTGLDLDAVLAAARVTEQAVGHELPSSLYRAGGRSVPRSAAAT